MSAPGPLPSDPDPSAGSGGRERSDFEGLTLVEIANILLRHRRALVVLPLTLAVAVSLVSLLMPPTFTSTVSITPQGADQSQLGRISGLAAQFGLEIPDGVERAESPRFYAELLRSRALLADIVETEFRIGHAVPVEEDRVATLIEFYEIEQPELELARAIAVDRLEDQIEIVTNAEISVVELSVTTSLPALSQQVADRMVELLNEFNGQTRRSRAEAERRFLGQRLNDARGDLAAAEDSLERFLERNRSYQNSPRLQFEKDRLQRRVDLQEQLVMSLAQSYEQARINEVRDTPVITVVEPAELPPRPDSRQLPIRAVLAFIVGGTVALVWAFGMELVTSAREDEPNHFAEFEHLKRDALDDLRDIWSRIRSLFRGDR